MKMKCNSITKGRFKQIMVVLIFLFTIQFVQAQISNPLEGLKLAGPGDIPPGTPLMLDPVSMPMYDEQFQKISQEGLMKIMMSNEYIPEPYIDDKKTVKAFVFRKATAEEQAMMLKMQQGGMGMEQKENALIGAKATDFTVKDLKGKKYALTELKGKIVVINFWFVECKPCVMEMPELNELVEEYKGKDIVFLALALNEKKQLNTFLKTTKFNYKVVSNGKSIADSYGVEGFPTNVIIDQEGIIQYVSTGIGPDNKSNLQKEINKLLIK